MKKKLRLIASLFCISLLNQAHAITVDFTDGLFTVIQDSGQANEPVIFSETVDGVTLTFESTANLVGIERFLGIQPGVVSNGLRLGGGGGSTLEFTLSTDKDIKLNSYSTDTGGFFLGGATVDISGNGVNSAANSLAQGNPENLFNDGPLLLLAGESYVFDIQNTGAAVQSYVDSIEFAPVPVPGAFWLFASALLIIRKRIFI